MHIKNAYILLWFLMLSAFVSAQQQPVKNYTMEDGLCSNTVRAITRDMDNNLWVGTDAGLSKFDGLHFTNYYKQDGLPNNAIRDIEVNKANELWLATYGDGIAKMKNDSIIAVYTIPGEPLNNNVRQLQLINSDTLLVGTDNGLFLFRDTSFERINYGEILDDKSSIVDMKRNNDIVWFTVHGDAGGLYAYNIKNKDIKKHITDKSLTGFLLENDEVLVKWTYKPMWIHLNSALNIQDTLFEKQKKDYIIWDMETWKGDTIIACWGGSYYSGGGFYKLNGLKIKEADFMSDAVSGWVLYKDTLNDMLWAGDVEKGLYAIWETPFVYSDKLDEDIIDVTTDESNRVWVLTSNALYNYEHGQFSLQTSKRELYDAIAITKPKMIDYSKFKIIEVYSIYDKLMISTNQGWISPFDKSFLNIKYSGVVFPDNKHGFYFCKDYTVVKHYHDLSDLSKVTELLNPKPLDIIDYHIKDNELILLSGWGGLFYYKQNGQVQQLNAENSEINRYLVGFEWINDSSLLVASKSTELYLVNIGNQLTIQKEFKQAVIGKTIRWMKCQGNNLLIYTEKGLNLIPCKNGNLQPNKLMLFNGGNSLITNDVKFGGYMQDERALLYSNNELIEFDARKISTMQDSNLSVEIIADGQNYGQFNQNLILPPRTEQISINMQLASQPDMRNTVFYYALNDNQFIELKNNSLELNELAPGNYKLYLKAIDYNTGRIIKTTKAFLIKKIWYLQSWFYLLVIVLLVSLVFLIMKRRQNAIKKRHLEKEEHTKRIASVKIQSLQSQMNPHFMFNALNSVQYLMITNRTDDALNYLNTLSSLIRDNLDFATHELIPLEQDLSFVQKYLQLEKLRFKEKFNYHIDTSHMQSLQYLVPPMILQTLLENSIKHGLRHRHRGGMLNVVFNEMENIIQVIIEDNGIGMEKSKLVNKDNPHKSMGLNILKERMFLLNKTHHTNLYAFEQADLSAKQDYPGTKTLVNLKKVIQKEK